MDFLLLMGYDFSFILSLILLILPFFFLSFFVSPKMSLILVGISADSVRTLPHVMKYQTVIPHKLKDSSLINDAATHEVTHSLLYCFNQFICINSLVKNTLKSLLCLSVCRRTLMFSSTL